eukprot:GHUV01031342.1.p1 GENE.GHUV01031342.1~~GHUV01031342.1.p1  ORF type:complete len:546 (-),score=92.84 GHUV01031342.1:366-2003(-)
MAALSSRCAWLTKLPSWIKSVQPSSQEGIDRFIDLMDVLEQYAPDPELFDHLLSEVITWDMCYKILAYTPMSQHPDEEDPLAYARRMTAYFVRKASSITPTPCEPEEPVDDAASISDSDLSDTAEGLTVPPPWLDEELRLEWLLTQDILREEKLPPMSWKQAPAHFNKHNALDLRDVTNSVNPSNVFTCQQQANQADSSAYGMHDALQEVLMALEFPYDDMDPDISSYLTAVDWSAIDDSTELLSATECDVEQFTHIYESDSPPDCYGPVPIHVATAAKHDDYVHVEGQTEMPMGQHTGIINDTSAVTLHVIDQPYSWALRDPKVLYVPETEVCPFPDDVETLDPDAAVELILEGSKLSPVPQSPVSQATDSLDCGEVLDSDDLEDLRELFIAPKPVAMLPWFPLSETDKVRIIIDGNIGSGKSTVIEYQQQTADEGGDKTHHQACSKLSLGSRHQQIVSPPNSSLPSRETCAWKPKYLPLASRHRLPSTWHLTVTALMPAPRGSRSQVLSCVPAQQQIAVIIVELPSLQHHHGPVWHVGARVTA